MTTIEKQREYSKKWAKTVKKCESCGRTYKASNRYQHERTKLHKELAEAKKANANDKENDVDEERLEQIAKKLIKMLKNPPKNNQSIS
jgi:hypothetical protein